MNPHIPIENRFWNKIIKSDGCWEWQAYKTPDGYGKIMDRGKVLSAHRVAYELTYGSIPKGMLICHHCDNPSCCNPAHLFLGTNKDNRLDCVRKGREGHAGGTPPGHRPASTKLTADQVREIRRLHKEIHSLQKIANLFDIDPTQVHHIVTKQQWKDI